MAHFALLWKARTIEKYRQKYENEKINSIILSNAEIPDKTLFQRWRHYSHGLQNRLSRTFSKWYPEGTAMSNFYMSLRTENMKLPHILLRSLYGFVGGLLLTYLGFMFFVFQLSLSLVHATILSTVLGIMITLGLTFSNRMRCLIFLLIPQLFSRVGRYTLTCYALVLILTGPATNTLKNSEVLSESMACSQEHIKTNIREINTSITKPFNAIKESMKITMQTMRVAVAKLKTALIRINRLFLSIASVTQSGYAWLGSVTEKCNNILGRPQDKCMAVMKDQFRNYVMEPKNAHNDKRHGNDPNNIKIKNKAAENTNKDDKHNPDKMTVNDAKTVKDAKRKERHANKRLANDYLATIVCSSLKAYDKFCVAADFVEQTILATIKRRAKSFVLSLSHLLHVKLNIHHSYIFIGNTSSSSQIASGIVTEIRNRADPILTWLSWSSCVTSLFLLLIIFRAKHYQHMFETRSRFDNRFITKEFRELDLKRLRERRETVLPLNRRERAKYVTTTSLRLVGSEKIHLNRSAMFMTVTTFKLLIHIVADYSLYWVLMTIRHHGKHQSPLHPSLSEVGSFISGSGFVSRLLQAFIDSLNVHLSLPPLDHTCLPNPHPPDVKRYCQIGLLIFLLWFFAIFEPYGLRLRHIIMGHYRPERAKTRAVWLYNHILRTRGSFMKFARRRLHREYKYSSQSNLTLKAWLQSVVPFGWLRALLGIKRADPHCLLCNITAKESTGCTVLIKCQVPSCPGTYCKSCFSDIGELCTICLSPSDYGDVSDMSMERGSSEDDSEGDNGVGKDFYGNDTGGRRGNVTYRTNTTSKASKYDNEKRFLSITEKRNDKSHENVPLLNRRSQECFINYNFSLLQTCNKSEVQLPIQDVFKMICNKNDEYLKDENNNDIVQFIYDKAIKNDMLQYSAYKINPTSKPFIIKIWHQPPTPLARYLRNKGILRYRKEKVSKKKQKSKHKCRKNRKHKNIAKKMSMRRISTDSVMKKNNAYKTKQHDKVNVLYFMTCTSPKRGVKNTSPIKKSDDAENKNTEQKKTIKKPKDNKSKDNNNETRSPKKDKENHVAQSTCMQKLQTMLWGYWTNPRTSTHDKKSKANSHASKEKIHERKKTRKKSEGPKDGKSKNRKELGKNSRILAYLDEWDWMQNHFASHKQTTVKKKEKNKKGMSHDKMVVTKNDNNDVEIVNDIVIPRLDLKIITDTTHNLEEETFLKVDITNRDERESEHLQKRSSFTRGALDRFFKSIVICRPFSKKEINKSCSSLCINNNEGIPITDTLNEVKNLEDPQMARVLSSFPGNRLSRPYSLLKNVYSSLLLRVNFINGSTATIEDKNVVETDNKEITVLPKTCSCAVQYDLVTERVETADVSVQVDLIAVEEKVLLIDAQVNAAQTMCTCATQYQIGSVNIGTSYTNNAICVLDSIAEPTDNSQSLSSNRRSPQSDDFETDTTLCSVAHTQYCAQCFDKRSKCANLIRHNRSTTTEVPNNCDVSTATYDWWSPISDKKDIKARDEENKAVNKDKEAMKEKRDKVGKKEKRDKETKNERRDKEAKKEKRCKHKNRDYEVRNEEKINNKLIAGGEKLVQFNRSAQIIPTAKFEDMMSPSRYLLESQRHYNELFYSSFNVRSSHLEELQKLQNAEKNRSHTHRPNNRRGCKAKRLEETYSLKKQIHKAEIS